MANENQTENISVQIANQLVDIANTLLTEGHTSADVASGMRHAAANFSAYDFFRTENLPRDPNMMVEEFVKFFEHYLDIHKPKGAPGDGLKNLIEQAKSEL